LRTLGKQYDTWHRRIAEYGSCVNVQLEPWHVTVAGLLPSLQGVFWKLGAEALRFKNGTFDLVVSCECLEHIPHPEQMTKEIRRVLVPAGRFILTTENYFNALILAWMKCWLTGSPFNSGSGVQPHENFFVYWRVQRMLERSGLVVDHMESNHFQWLLLPRTDPEKLCIEEVDSAFCKRLFRPFGRHFTFCGFRPN